MSNENQVATSVLPKTRQQWNLDNTKFVEVYNRSNCVKQVAEELKVPIGVCNSRASYLRKKGVHLKHFDGVRVRINVSELNKLIDGETAPAEQG